jgi:hypothetical protein
MTAGTTRDTHQTEFFFTVKKRHISRAEFLAAIRYA